MENRSDPRLNLSVDGAVALLTVDRVDKLNALDGGLVRALLHTCREIEHHPKARVVIITGAGNKAFSAGGDIEAWSAESPQAFGRHWVREGHDAFDALARLRQPVIAVLNGHALGGGLELAASADIRIAEAHAKIGQPESGLGIIPGWSGTQRAVRRFGPQNVRLMALFGEIFTAEQALERGIVDEVVAMGNGLTRAMEIAHRVAERGRAATEMTKMLVNAAEGEERERVLEALAGTAAAHSDELQEGLAAFREKRKPDFSGK